ncbi:MAG: polysaccharide deacetylase family protein [Porticoccaceae bacterium]
MNSLLHSAVVSVLPTLLGTKNTQRLSILNYHRVLPEPDFMRMALPTVSEFEWQMELLAQHFNPLPLSEALSLMDYGELPERAVCVTFDDGYADNQALALPVLQRLGVPATIYVATGYLDGGRMWNDTIVEAMRIASKKKVDLSAIGLGIHNINGQDDRRKAAASIISEVKHWPPAKREAAIQYIAAIEMNGELPTNLMLTTEQLKGLSDSGVDIGAHTTTHPILATLELSEARKEILGSKDELESIIGKTVDNFAYPNGRPEIDYHVEHRDLAELAGYKSAVSTQWGWRRKPVTAGSFPGLHPGIKRPRGF